MVRSLPTLPSEARVRHLGFTMWLKGAMQPPGLPGQDEPRSPASIELDGLELLEEALQKARAFRDLESLGINVLGNASSDTESGPDAEARILSDVQQMLPSLALKGIISVGWSGYACVFLPDVVACTDVSACFADLSTTPSRLQMPRRTSELRCWTYAVKVLAGNTVQHCQQSGAIENNGVEAVLLPCNDDPDGEHCGRSDTQRHS